ncbi:hypothetical protein Tco_0849271 [Tanacetum coccineum]
MMTMMTIMTRRTIPLNEIISQIPPSIAITPVLPTMEPEDSLNIGDKHLSTIPKKESDEVIKSSVENHFPILSESEDTTDGDKECDLPFSVIFSNPLFDFNDDFTSSDDESFPEEDKLMKMSVSTKEAILMRSKLVLQVIQFLRELMVPIFDPEGDILLLEKLLNDDPSSPLPPKELYFEDLKVIKSSIDTLSDLEDDYYDSKEDIIYLESLLIKDTTHNLPPKVFLDIDPKSLNDEHDFDNLKSMVKVFDPGIHEKFFSPTYVKLPFEDRHYFSFTFAIKFFLPYLTYSVNSLFILSFGSEDIIFDPSISAISFYSLEPVDCSDYEDSRARGFVHRSLKLQSLACLYMGIRYPRSY